MDDLTLPNPARKLWLETRDIVRKALEQLQPGIEYRIGGGTILAAGWKHRGSFDVDLQVPKGTKLDELQGAAYGWLDTELKRLGAKPGYRARLNLFTITRGEKPTSRKYRSGATNPRSEGVPPVVESRQRQTHITPPSANRQGRRPLRRGAPSASIDAHSP